MLSRLTYRKYINAQEQFRINVERNPAKCDLVFSELISEGAFTDFTGDSKRVEKVYTVPCLYKREFSPAERIKYGLHIKVSGVIYLAPQNLVEQLGYWKINGKKFWVMLNEIKYGINEVIYQAPFYDTCICVETRLMDSEEQ